MKQLISFVTATCLNHQTCIRRVTIHNMVQFNIKAWCYTLLVNRDWFTSYMVASVRMRQAPLYILLTATFIDCNTIFKYFY